MTTAEKVMQDVDKLGATALRIKVQRDVLFAACKRAYAAIDDRYDVEQFTDGSSKEYPFEGAGEVLRILESAINNSVAG